MYSAGQSDHGVGTNSVTTSCPQDISEYLETNWNPGKMDQNMSSNGPYGFPYCHGLEERSLDNSSAGTLYDNFARNSESSGSRNVKEKKRKGIADNVAMPDPSPRSSSQNAGDQQMEAPSQSVWNPVEKDETRSSSKMQSKEDSSDGDLPKEDYIHVRAKRGQATNSHSLAERLRRKKISERMKLLQDLVPGCSKITGKAVMLDEIINYVQSLQRQVEFLSMKLAAVNPDLGFDIEQLLTKEVFLSQERLSAFYGSDQATSAFLNQFTGPTIQGQMQSEMLCNFSNPGNVPRIAFPDLSTINQISGMWSSALQNVPHMEFSSGIAADHTENTGSMKMEQQ